MSSDPPNHNKPWSDRDKKMLGFHWGVFSLKTLGERFGRTPWGVAQMARELKLGPFSKGTISMLQFERLSGFSRPKILAAAKALGIRLDRITNSYPGPQKKTRMYAITEEQQEPLLAHMLEHPVYLPNTPGAKKTTQGAWGLGWKPEACLDCQRNDIPHYSKGRCSTCHRRYLRKNKNMSEPIRSFNFKYRFLSNFHPAEVEFEGVLYFSTEHAYQAAKTLDLKKREPLQARSGTELSVSAGKAKRWGRSVALRPDWEEVKLGIMEDLLREKFTRHPDLAQALLDTGDRELIEGNTWGDRFWGQCEAEGILSGDNHLGKLLMKIRAELRDQ